MFDPNLFTVPADRVGAFSKSQSYGVFECYRHLQGDLMYVAENRTNGRRQFFRDPAEVQEWVEAQPRNTHIQRMGFYSWKPGRNTP